jgi:hypothetical protein
MADKRIVGMPAYTDPDRPETQGGSVNYPPDEHPVEHSDDYGQGAQLSEPEVPQVSDADREDWKKDDWKAQAAAYGLPVSGNMDELKSRVEEYEAEQDDNE